MSDLIRHGLAVRFHGFPVFDEAGNYTGTITEAKWKLERLSREDQELLGEKIFDALHSPHRPAEYPDEKVYAAVLEDYGIDCPHPSHWRIDLQGSPSCLGFECRACGCLVVQVEKVSHDRQNFR
jgi:hypothetical protein